MINLKEVNMAKSGFLKRFLRKKRKYPIKKNKYGWSNRYRSMLCFDNGMTPAQVAAASDGEISLRTACRYYAQWKKRPRDLEHMYRVIKEVLKRHPAFSETLLKNTADRLGLPLDELKERLEEPWGLKRLLLGRWPEQVDESKDRPTSKDKYKQLVRFKAAFTLLYLYEVRNVPIEKIMEVLEKLDEQYHPPQSEEGTGH